MTHSDRSGPHAIERQDDRGPWYRRVKSVYAIVYSAAVVSCAVAHEDKLVAVEIKGLIDERMNQMIANQKANQDETRLWMNQQGKMTFQMSTDIDLLKGQYANLNQSRVDHEKRIEKLEKPKP
jgi:hypothetical protein